jgi:hypothetical protein
MTHATQLPTLSIDTLRAATGGAAKLDFNAIRQKAEQYCPATAQKFAKVDPATVDRAKAQQMGNACLAEMGGFQAMFARAPLQAAIDQAFPK